VNGDVEAACDAISTILQHDIDEIREMTEAPK